MARGAPAPSSPAKRGRPAKEVPVEIEAMSTKKKVKADKAAKEKPGERVKQKATTRTVDNAAQEAIAAAREAQAREELEGMEESANDKLLLLLPDVAKMLLIVSLRKCRRTLRRQTSM
jgi:hypothetical protein